MENRAVKKVIVVYEDGSEEVWRRAPRKPLEWIGGELPALTGEEVKQLRKRMGLTQGQLAEFLCVSQARISDWERGTLQLTPKVSRFLQLAFEKIEQNQGGT